MFAAANSPPKLITLILLTAVSILSLNMFLPSLPNIASALQADYGLVNLSIAGYLAITAVLQIVMGPLSDRFGRRPVLLASLAIFAGASLGCALANDIWTFLFFRVLQGAIISGMALSRAVIRDMVPAQEAASLLGYVSMAMALAPMLGPMFGGVLEEFFGWRASFYAFMVMGIVLYWLCWADLGETNVTPSETFTAQFRTYPELIRSRRFWGYSFCMAFSVGAFYAFLAGAPLVVERLFSMSPAILGLCLGTISLGFAFGSFLSGRLARRYSLLTLIMWGRIVACIGLAAGLMLFVLGFVNAATLFGATIFVGLGNGLTLPSANAGAMSVRPHLAGSASGLSGAMTVGGGAVLTWATGLVITETNGAYALLGMMLFSSAAGLVSALYVWRIDMQEARSTTVQPE
ncbi:multidrug effflux MFS transporter [Pelagibacterium lentulum]|uniref:Bcr/CflA family efflux transporter n=1 Tax=Pelagibacterium lentulum TaxID=2029865 RepID=A0A916VW78_9HYPH|nr:multidrug effflux MFS transporter [Pelagibacterium lentulum]GGA45384.1 Bcr/CflA family drug resistance efflux transporter [Pelagibacterium lentulum]